MTTFDPWWIRSHWWALFAIVLLVVTLFIGRQLYASGDKLWGTIWMGGGILMGVLLYPWPNRRNDPP